MPNTKSTKKKKTNTKKQKKKGFTLVELLAVIIILAIVVGITIPAVMTTTSSAKQKAFETAAQTFATWIDEQYQQSVSGLSDYGLVTIDESYKELCVRKCRYPTAGTTCDGDNVRINHPTAGSINKSDFYNSGDSDNPCSCNCDLRVTMLTPNIVEAGGLKSENIEIVAKQIKSSSGNTLYNGYRVKEIDGIKYVMSANSATTKYSLGDNANSYSKVYINPETGRSCVTLKASSNGDYPSGAVVCGGICQNDSNKKNQPDYCNPS